MTWRADAAGARREGEAGFTLFELIIVFAIFALVLVMLVSRVNGPSAALTLRASANQIAAALREARSMAIATNKPATVAIDSAHHDWRAGDGTARALPATASVVVKNINGEPTASPLSFEIDGSSSGGSIELADGKRRIAIAVDWISGRVTVADVH